MADEHVLLPRERYQRLLEKAAKGKDKEKTNEPRKDTSNKGKIIESGKVVQQQVHNRRENEADKTPVKKITKKKQLKKTLMAREDRPPGIPAISKSNDWIRF